jgi:RNA polymerase sigma factor (sigma-70 family)
MKRTKSKPKLTESSIDYENPNYVEIPMSHEDLEKAAKKQSLLLEQKQDYELRKHIVRKQEKLLKKIFKASSQVLTDAQFQIFSMRYIYQMPESEIAQQVGCVQNYVSRALKASIKKIQKRLRVPINLKGFAKDRKNKDE